MSTRDAGKNAAAVALGRLGGLKEGKARARKVTADLVCTRHDGRV
jgi:hypothetical protein